MIDPKKLENLNMLEKETYDFIKANVDVQPRNLPNKRMTGVVSILKRKGLVKIYRKYPDMVNQRKKRKFVKATC